MAPAHQCLPGHPAVSGTPGGPRSRTGRDAHKTATINPTGTLGGRHFELTAGEWRADPETGRSPPSDFEDDQDNNFEDDEHDEPGVASG